MQSRILLGSLAVTNAYQAALAPRAAAPATAVQMSAIQPGDVGTTRPLGVWDPLGLMVRRRCCIFYSSRISSQPDAAHACRCLRAASQTKMPEKYRRWQASSRTHEPNDERRWRARNRSCCCSTA